MVGIGPGNLEQMSFKAHRTVREADVIIGYKTYVDLIRELIDNQEVIDSGMTREVERSLLAIDKALTGAKVAIISSGDAGIYGMAGIVLELVVKGGHDLEVEIIPGISSANAAAASLGAPLMHDFVTISLSDLLTPWEVIEKRLHFAAQGDFVVNLYNPMSKKRTEQIKIARDIMLRYKAGETPVGIVRNAKRGDEVITITTLEKMLDHPIDMFSVIIIGNSETFSSGGFMITPRGYKV